ncbi:MAG: 30S ribosomal protein S9 [Polyangia bacterium]|jgi:small subunit ribosomal protein S9|nr:30S ribosomal protein S9 [Polyangia bacterium]
MATDTKWYATGRRKHAVARVWMTPGTGQIVVNKRSFEDYFARATSRMVVMQPLDLVEATGRVDIRINVCGGGMSGQASAVKHGISRALEKMAGELRPTLKKAGFLTRDARVKERKKYGRRGARARFQFSKR